MQQPLRVLGGLFALIAIPTIVEPACSTIPFRTCEDAVACDDKNPCTTEICQNGECIYTAANDQVPDDQKECTEDTCKDGEATHVILTGKACGSKKELQCSDQGECSNCTSSEQCQSPEECRRFNCDLSTHTCKEENFPVTHPLDDTNPGDCKRRKCDGDGSPVVVNDDMDVPSAAADDCKANTCVNGVASVVGAAEGVLCTDKSKLCNAAGACVTCTDKFGCAGNQKCFKESECVSCDDVVKNGTESDIDCGGATCNKCDDGKSCNSAADCASAGCLGGTCSPCANGIKDLTETDVDCGGTCGKCDDGKKCDVGNDCLTGGCLNKICSHCANNAPDPTESAVDCGGDCLKKCADGNSCKSAADCETNGCADNICSHCANTMTDLGESDVDCGGTDCKKCVDGNVCVVKGDCVTGGCLAGKCSHCANGNADLGETGVDCGGSCLSCNGEVCSELDGSSCKSGNCFDGVCCLSSCNGVCKSCNAPGFPGSCTIVPTGVNDPDTCGLPTNACKQTVNSLSCESVGNSKKVGGACFLDIDCFNGTCSAGFCRLALNDICANDADCETNLCLNHFCKHCTSNMQCLSDMCFGSGGNKKCKASIGEPCGVSSDCAKGSCIGSLCKLSGASGCAFDVECWTGMCAGGLCSGPCAGPSDCVSSNFCSNGICLLPPGAYCATDMQCASGQCNQFPKKCQ